MFCTEHIHENFLSQTKNFNPYTMIIIISIFPSCRVIVPERLSIALLCYLEAESSTLVKAFTIFHLVYSLRTSFSNIKFKQHKFCYPGFSLEDVFFNCLQPQYKGSLYHIKLSRNFQHHIHMEFCFVRSRMVPNYQVSAWLNEF